MKKIITWIIIIALGAALAGYIYLKSTAAHKDPLKADLVKIQATELYRMFENFEDSATKLYTDGKRSKAIAVVGVVKDISQKDNRYTISLEAGSDMGAVICEMDTVENTVVKNFKTGETKEIVGYCNGYLIDVQMFRCKLAK